MDEELTQAMLHPPYRVDLPTPEQVAAFLAACALASPALLGGIPVLPSAAYDERRRQQEQIVQESSSTVGIYHEVHEAEVALRLSQNRLAAATRDVTGTTARAITEADVVRAAHAVGAGNTAPTFSRRFRSALQRVAYDSVDLFILEQGDERASDDVDEPTPLTDEEFWAEFE